MLTSDLIKTTHIFSGKDAEPEAIKAKLSADRLVTAQQIHSSIVLVAGEDDEPVGDALITNKPGLAIGVYTADCGPVLMHDKDAGVIAAVHAGWRGARYGIIESAIHEMKKLKAKDIVAVLGPCIHQKSYEIDINFISSFRQESSENEKFFIPSKNQGHFMFDLPGYIKYKLERAGASRVEVMNEDTLSQPDKFCSFRRDTLAGVKNTGRQISAICLQN